MKRSVNFRGRPGRGRNRTTGRDLVAIGRLVGMSDEQIKEAFAKPTETDPALDFGDPMLCTRDADPLGRAE
jgi:hypothetical protein